MFKMKWAGAAATGIHLEHRPQSLRHDADSGGPGGSIMMELGLPVAGQLSFRAQRELESALRLRVTVTVAHWH
jgi:hypothetical protein